MQRRKFLSSAGAALAAGAAAVPTLTQAQTAYQAALQSGAQILQHSLLDYLR